MKVTLDIETNTTKKNGKLHLDPFEPTNSLVFVGIRTDQGIEECFPFDHPEHLSGHKYHERVQWFLDNATVLICHNASFELSWLWQCGFKYDGPVWDTMLVEYVLQRGDKEGSLSLSACAERHNLTRKLGTLQEYYDKGCNTNEVPLDELAEYCMTDVKATQELADLQWSKLNTKEYSSLMKTVDLTNSLCKVLSHMYINGIKVDLNKLEEVRKEYEQEKEQLTKELYQDTQELMGDTKINLSSPEQLSWVVYSRKPQDKNVWANSYSEYMKDREWRDLIRLQTDVVYKTLAEKCDVCNGKGYVRKTKRDGTPYAKDNKCIACRADGFIYNNTKKVAGLKFMPPSSKWASANGFSTGKDSLKHLERQAKSKGMTKAESFLSKVIRLNAVESYISTYVNGIEAFTKPDGMLHVSLMQHRTATGRLSGSNPNMQNMPRGGTFPVKRVFVSRWEDGKIMEADFAQLEFRVAAFLSQDGVAIEEVKTGFDVHSYTAKVISDAGQKTSRQEAKAHTFAPLYGATGFGRTSAEAAYYEHFTEKYEKIGVWHSRLAEEALINRCITVPSGRQYSFPKVQRRPNGSVTHFTNIKNYPVQGFATADIVPLAMIHMYTLLQNFKSCIVNTVHDSIVIDVHPDEEKGVIEVINKTNRELINLINSKWEIDFNVPLLLEAKIGKNWLDTKDIV